MRVGEPNEDAFEPTRDLISKDFYEAGREEFCPREKMSAEVVAVENGGAADAEKVIAEPVVAEDATMADAPATPGTDVAGAEDAPQEAAQGKWLANAVKAERGEILLTINQSIKAPKGYAYMPAGDYAPFEANWMESKKRVRKPSAKADGGVGDFSGGMFAAPTAGDDSAKIPEKPDEELTEEERELRRIQRKEQKRRQKEELLARLKAIEEAKTKVQKIEEEKKAHFASLPPPRPASTRPIKATPTYSSYSAGGSKGGKKSAAAMASAGYKKMRDGRFITNARLQREHEIDQERQLRHKDMIRRCREVLNVTKKHKFHRIFLYPVDAVRLGIPDYYDIIKQPMDLGAVKKKLDDRKYENPEQFRDDMRLIWQNCATYNAPDSDAGHMGAVMKNEFENAWLNSQLEEYTARDQAVRAQEEIDIRNTPATPISQEAVAVQEAREQLEKMRREIEELRRAKQEAMYKDDDFFDDDEPVPRPKSRSRGGAQKRKADPEEDPDFDFDDARMDEDVYKEFREEKRARSEIKRAARAETALPKREMSFEEKHDLTMLLQELPEEKQGRVVQIVSERKKGMDQADDDEIEINIEELDSETLWKLDKYVRGVLRPKKRKLNAAEQLLEAKMREAQAARELAAVEDTLKHVQETGGSYKEVVDAQTGKKPQAAPAAGAAAAASDSDDSDSDSDTSSYDSAEGAGSNPEKRGAAAVTSRPGAVPVDQSTNVFANEAPGIKQNVSKAAVNIQNPSGWETLASSDAPSAPAAPAAAATQDAIPDDLWSEFEAAAQQKQQLDKSRQEDAAQAEAERARLEAEKKAEEEAKKRAVEEAKEAEIRAREEARAKAREELENTTQTVDLEEQRLAMKEFGGDGMGGMMGAIDTKQLKGDGQ